MKRFLLDLMLTTIIVLIVEGEPKAWLIKKLEDPEVKEAILRALIYLKSRVTRKN